MPIGFESGLEYFVLNAMETVTTDDVAAKWALKERTEHKYEMSEKDVASLFAVMAPTWAVMEEPIHGAFFQWYSTLYYDTPDFQLYRDDKNLDPKRQKVRLRYYGGPGAQVLLEIKEGMHSKYRVPVPYDFPAYDGQCVLSTLEDELNAPYDGLQPVLWTRYGRLALVNLQAEERISLDRELSYEAWSRDDSGEVAQFPDRIIFEVKFPVDAQASLDSYSRQCFTYLNHFGKYAEAVEKLGLVA